MFKTAGLVALAIVALSSSRCAHGSRALNNAPASAAGDADNRMDAEMKDITPTQAAKVLESDKRYVYLDVRTVPEFEASHVPGAWNVPVVLPTAAGNAMERNPRFLPVIGANFPKDQHMIVGCRSGGRSAMAVELLLQAGFKNARNMEGGFGGSEHQAGWSQCGLPSEKGEGGERGYEQLSAKAR